MLLLPFVEVYVLCSNVGFKGNLSLLEICYVFFPGGLSKWKTPRHFQAYSQSPMAFSLMLGQGYGQLWVRQRKRSAPILQLMRGHFRLFFFRGIPLPTVQGLVRLAKAEKKHVKRVRVCVCVCVYLRLGKVKPLSAYALPQPRALGVQSRSEVPDLSEHGGALLRLGVRASGESAAPEFLHRLGGLDFATLNIFGGVSGNHQPLVRWSQL